MYLPEKDLESMLRTNTSYDIQTCLNAIKNAVAYYQKLRNSLMEDKIEHRTKAELSVIKYLDEIG